MDTAFFTSIQSWPKPCFVIDDWLEAQSALISRASWCPAYPTSLLSLSCWRSFVLSEYVDSLGSATGVKSNKFYQSIHLILTIFESKAEHNRCKSILLLQCSAFDSERLSSVPFLHFLCCTCCPPQGFLELESQLLPVVIYQFPHSRYHWWQPVVEFFALLVVIQVH